jgi:hypothetical protein
VNNEEKYGWDIISNSRRAIKMKNGDWKGEPHSKFWKLKLKQLM